MRTITELTKIYGKVYVSGWASNMYYFQNKKKVVTVNYEKYIEGYEDYLVK